MPGASAHRGSAGARRTVRTVTVGVLRGGLMEGKDMRTLVAPAALLLACTDSRADVADAPKRTMPHQEKCTAALPADFWDDSDAKRFENAEAWAWNVRICLGHWADMRYAPGGSGDGDECKSAEIEKTREAVPAYRELRPEFLELILSHEPWASVPRHPEVGIRCALVPGDIYLDDHEIAPALWFSNGKIDLITYQAQPS